MLLGPGPAPGSRPLSSEQTLQDHPEENPPERSRDCVQTLEGVLKPGVKCFPNMVWQRVPTFHMACLQFFLDPAFVDMGPQTFAVP